MDPFTPLTNVLVHLTPDNNKMCVSASQDCTLVAWDVSESGKSVSPKYMFKGHSASVEGVAISADADKVFPLFMLYHH